MSKWLKAPEGAFLCQEKDVGFVMSVENNKGAGLFDWMKRIEIEEVYVFLMTVLLGIFIGMAVTNFLVSLVQFVLRN